MKLRSGLLLSGATATLLLGTAGLAPPAFAQSAANWAVDTSANVGPNAGIYEDLTTAGWGTGYNTLPGAGPAPGLPVKAAPPPPPTWWFHGFLEVGGRGFTNNPQDGGSRWQGGGSSLAKYYEYSDIAPGAFGNFWLATGTSNGLYEVDVWGKNVGYDDQRYIADFSKAGEHYFTFGWDQTPHTYSDGASTLYNGVGSTNLTLPPGLSALLFSAAGCGSAGPGGTPSGCSAGPPANTISPANAAVVRTDILNSVHQVGLGIQRDTASLDYRYTPDDSWDVRVNYTNIRRTGTQIEGIVFSSSTSGVEVQAPKPVADTTQNYGASAEYNGTSPWNQKYNVKLAYSGSTYTDDSDRWFIANPFCPNGATGDQCARSNQTAPNNALSSPVAMMSLWPDNQANGGTATLGADLPWKSRYMGTISYTVMNQNQQFMPFTTTAAFANNGGANVPAGWKGIPGIAANSLAALPAQSLNGDINTLLSNNVLTTQITSDIKSKLSYRYYNYDNQTPEIFFPDWVQSDAVAGSAQSLHAPVNSLTISYVKQNAGADLNWRPDWNWNVGAAYEFERYDWTRADASATNESTGKVYGDYKATGWLTARGSIGYGLRRADNYNYLGNVGLFQWPGLPLGTAAGIYSSAARQFYLDDRDRTVAKFQVDVALWPGAVLTPSVAYRDDWYGFNPLLNEGLASNKVISAGVEFTYAINDDTHVLLAYMNDHQMQRLTMDSGDPINGPFKPANLWQTTVDDHVNTYMAALDQVIIPNKLDMRFAYTLSDAVDHQPWGSPAQTLSVAGTNFPDVKTLWQRIDITGIYTFDQDFVHSLGWKGKVQAKLRYAWERNSVANWQNDMMSPYMYSSSVTGSGFQTWMAFDNPNYNAQIIYGSIVAGW